MSQLSALFLVAFVATNSWASHHSSCELEVKVIDVKNLARLDGEATFTGSPAAPMAPKNDFEQLVTLEVLKVVKLNSRTCLGEAATATLYVQPKQQGTYAVGQVLNVDYLNQGDRLGSRVTWTVRKP
jgi:hypothetical protein